MADDKIFTIELPQLPPGAAFEGYAKAKASMTLQAVGALARSNWISMAQERLDKRRMDMHEYIRSISAVNIMPDSAVITLTGKRAHDLEFGRPSYDLRTVLLGPNVKIKKRGQSIKGKYKNKQGGFYRYIPFSHQGPETLGTTGAAMGSQFAPLMGHDSALELGKFIQRTAKSLDASLEKSNRKVRWGQRLPAQLAPKLRPWHATDIFAGMYKIRKDYKNDKTKKVSTGYSYKTFRTISTSVTRGWIVPSTTGLFLLRKVRERLNESIPAFVAQMQSKS